MTPLRLVIFDVDGTLVDSQGSIVGAMTAALVEEGLVVPTRAEILSIVGLSLDHAVARLMPDIDTAQRGKVVAGYKDAYHAARVAGGVAIESPLYPGIREMLVDLSRDSEVLLGVATGKSRRGLDALIEGHELGQFFVTQQCADDHPSKPHPSMLTTALYETGVEAADAVMVGDTSYDMDMAAAAGVAGLGVSWGYHRPDALTAARRVVNSAAEVPAAIAEMWETTA
ncbi:HAD-IA family hydrolase [Chachezhania antarctica]|uniref:HAD-IA family hydrolase n=1 Tax=Chachezhania antarctica TaxID=2340860 RepID=UPI001F09B6E5|nr:HAD-IA family hydrolase [Chachezhania antarctica]